MSDENIQGEPQPDPKGEESTDGGSSSSDLVGKKIFFLYPTASVQQQIITELVQQEYEVYIAKDHARLAQALKKYSDSVVFANIDEGMPAQEWERWIGGLFTSSPNIKAGIFSSNTDEEFRDKYVNKLHVTCGFFALKLDMSKTTDKVIEVLKIMNVKGRRKYLRATTERESTATLNMPHHGEFINGVIKDISVVGVSCVFENDPGLPKNALFKDIQIRLQTMLLKVEAVSFGSRDNNGEKIYVLLFTQRIDPDVRVKIRKYIQVNLQNKMDFEIS
jgi:hypothetical protein